MIFIQNFQYFKHSTYQVIIKFAQKYNNYTNNVIRIRYNLYTFVVVERNFSFPPSLMRARHQVKDKIEFFYVLYLFIYCL